MKTVEPKLPDTATGIYNGILKQGYECDNAACNRDSVKDFKVNGHTVGQTWKYLEKDLQIFPLTVFDKPETFEEFSERVTGYMCAIEGDLPPDEWHTEFKEKLYTALKSSTNTNIVSPEIKGVVQSNKYMTKKELWSLFLAEKRGVSEEERKKKEKKEKEERERRAEKERVEKEKAEKEKAEKEKREQEVKNKEIDEHAKKYGLSYNGSYFVFWSSPEINKIPSYYRNELISKAEKALHNIYKLSTYDINNDFENLIRKKAPLEDIIAKPSLWGGGVREAQEFALDYDDDIYYTESTRLLKEQLQELLDKVRKYEEEAEKEGLASVFTDILYGFGRAVICKRTQEESPFTNFENSLFKGECSKYVDINNPVAGFKKFIKEFNFSTWKDREEYYEEDSMKLFMDNLEEIKNQIGVGGMNLGISPETKQYAKDVAKEGMEQGALRSATKKISRLVARRLAARSGKKGKALSALTDSLATLFEGPEGQAIAGVILARAIPVIGAKIGRSEAAERLARKFDVQAVAIVSEQVTDVAVDLAEMGLGELMNILKPLMEEGGSVDVTPFASLGAVSTQSVEAPKKVVETVS